MPRLEASLTNSGIPRVDEDDHRAGGLPHDLVDQARARGPSSRRARRGRRPAVRGRSRGPRLRPRSRARSPRDRARPLSGRPGPAGPFARWRSGPADARSRDNSSWPHSGDSRLLLVAGRRVLAECRTRGCRMFVRFASNLGRARVSAPSFGRVDALTMNGLREITRSGARLCPPRKSLAGSRRQLERCSSQEGHLRLARLRDRRVHVRQQRRRHDDDLDRRRIQRRVPRCRAGGR